jgi:sporulation protein YlmC with PRC-barrel domain
MSSFSVDDPQSLYGSMAYDRDGVEVGEIEAVYVDAASGRPAWAAVRTGRQETSLAPLAEAVSTDEGVRLAVDHRLVQRGPHGDDSGRFPEELSEEQEAELNHYYSVDYTAGAGVEGPGKAPAGSRRGTAAERLRGVAEGDTGG